MWRNRNRECGRDATILIYDDQDEKIIASINNSYDHDINDTDNDDNNNSNDNNDDNHNNNNNNNNNEIHD